MKKLLFLIVGILGVLNVYSQSMEWLYRPGKFSSVQYMGNNLFKVRNEQGAYGVVSSKGNELLALKYDSITSFVEDRALVLDKKGKRILAILATDGKIVNSFADKTIYTTSYSAYKEDLLSFKDEKGLCGYLNKNGEITISPRFYLAAPFQNGIATVQYSYQDADSEGYYGLINKFGLPAIVSDKKYSFLSSVVSDTLFALTSSLRGGNVLKVMKLEGNQLKDVQKLESKMFIDISDDFSHLACQNGNYYMIDEQWRIFDTNYKFKMPYSITDRKTFVIQTSELLSKQFTERGVQITYMGKPIMEHAFNEVATYEKKYAIVYSKSKKVGVLKLNPSAGIELTRPTDTIVFHHNPLPADLSANIEEVDSRHSVKIQVDIKDVNPAQLKCYINDKGYLSYIPMKKVENQWYLYLPYFQPDSIYNNVITNNIDIAVTYDGLDWMHRSLVLSSKHESGYDVSIVGDGVADQEGKAVLRILVHSLKGSSNVETIVKVTGREPVKFRGLSSEIPVEVFVPQGTSKIFTYTVIVSEQGCPVIRKEVTKKVISPKQKKEKKRFSLV